MKLEEAAISAATLKKDINMSNTMPHMPSPMQQARNRFAAALRQMLFPVARRSRSLDRDGIVFMHGDRLDLGVLRDIGPIVQGMDADTIFIEFAPGRADFDCVRLHFIAPRDGVLHLTRDCRLWLDRSGAQAVLVPPSGRPRHYVCDGDEVIAVAGAIAASAAPGLARGEKAWRELAAAQPATEGRRCFSPWATAA